LRKIDRSGCSLVAITRADDMIDNHTGGWLIRPVSQIEASEAVLKFRHVSSHDLI